MNGIWSALAAALLFGAATPLSKLLLGPVDPWLLAGVLYLGSGVGLGLIRVVRVHGGPRVSSRELPWLIAAIGFGGLIGPVLLMWGLARTSASSVSLLLNAETVLTALIAWFVFHENFDRRIALGMLLIVLGAAILSSPRGANVEGILPAIAIIGACLAWALDNNFTRKVALADATTIAMLKGLVAGTVNVGLALLYGAAVPQFLPLAAAALLGFASYGMSLVLFVIALRALGAARTGAYFSTAPFVGAVLSVLMLHEPVTWRYVMAMISMIAGVWLHVTERHIHVHAHEAIDHEHEHEHDAHHHHSHGESVQPGTRHSHWHHHEPMVHSHDHYPDSHHRHRH